MANYMIRTVCMVVDQAQPFYHAQSRNFLACTLSGLTPRFYETLHRPFTTYQKDCLASSLATLSFLRHAFAQLLTGRPIVPSERMDIATSMCVFLRLSWRRRFDATYAFFFLPTTSHFIHMYLRTPEGNREHIPRAYHLFVRFYLQLLIAPWGVIDFGMTLRPAGESWNEP